MCRQSHHALRTRCQLPHQLFPKGQIWLSPLRTASPAPGVPMGHFPTPKGSHLFLPPVGQAFGGIINSPVSTSPVPLCTLGSAKCSIPDLEARDEDRDEPARTDSTTNPTSSTNPGQDTPTSFISLHAFLPSRFPAPLSPQLCHTAAGLPALPPPAQQRCSCHALTRPAVSCSLALEIRHAEGLSGGLRELKRVPEPNRSCGREQRDPASHLGVILPRDRQNGWTDASLAKAPQSDFPSPIPSFLFFSFNFVSEDTIL